MQVNPGLFEAAAQGRGLWAGIFPVTPIEGIDGDQHITLAHFGRKVDASLVDRAITACQRAAVAQYGVIITMSWGTARLDQAKSSVIALLFEGLNIEKLRTELLVQCGAGKIRVDDRFGFHPHLTLERIEEGNAPATVMPRRPKVELRFAELALVCGDARMTFPFASPPF